MNPLLFVLLSLGAANALAAGRIVHGVGKYAGAWQGAPRPNADLDAARQCSGDAYNPAPVERITPYEEYRDGDTSVAEADYLCLDH